MRMIRFILSIPNVIDHVVRVKKTDYDKTIIVKFEINEEDEEKEGVSLLNEVEDWIGYVYEKQGYVLKDDPEVKDITINLYNKIELFERWTLKKARPKSITFGDVGWSIPIMDVEIEFVFEEVEYFNPSGELELPPVLNDYLQ